MKSYLTNGRDIFLEEASKDYDKLDGVMKHLIEVAIKRLEVHRAKVRRTGALSAVFKDLGNIPNAKLVEFKELKYLIVRIC